MSNYTLVIIIISYLAILFFIAFLAEKNAKSRWVNNPYVYMLSLAVYCSAWTYYGSIGIAANSDVSLELTGKFSEDLAFNGVAFDDKNFNLDWDSSDSSEAPIITGSGFVATEDSGVYHLSDEFPGYNLVGEANEFSLVEQTGAYGGVLELETSTGSFIYKVNNQNTDVQYLNNNEKLIEEFQRLEI